MRVTRLSLAAKVAVVLLLAGCGNGSDTETQTETAHKQPQHLRPAWITLDSYMEAETVGLLMAKERGYFEDVGVEMTITHAVAPGRPIRYVREGTVDFGVAHQPQVVMAKEKGVPIVAVGALLHRPAAAMIWLKKSKIGGIADLKEKTIAVPGVPFQEEFLRHVLKRAGLTLDDVKLERVGYELVPALVGGRADAIFGGSWNVEGAMLAALGLKPVVTRVRSLGIPAYDEQVLITRTGLAAKDPRLVRDVMTAVARGVAAAAEHPKAAIKVVESSVEVDPNATRRVTEAEMRATLPLLSETGYMDPRQADQLVSWMHREGMIRKEISSRELFSDDYLP